MKMVIGISADRRHIRAFANLMNNIIFHFGHLIKLLQILDAGKVNRYTSPV